MAKKSKNQEKRVSNKRAQKKRVPTTNQASSIIPLPLRARASSDSESDSGWSSSSNNSNIEASNSASGSDNAASSPVNRWSMPTRTQKKTPILVRQESLSSRIDSLVDAVFKDYQALIDIIQRIEDDFKYITKSDVYSHLEWSESQSAYEIRDGLVYFTKTPSDIFYEAEPYRSLNELNEANSTDRNRCQRYRKSLESFKKELNDKLDEEDISVLREKEGTLDKALALLEEHQENIDSIPDITTRIKASDKFQFMKGEVLENGRKVSPTGKRTKFNAFRELQEIENDIVNAARRYKDYELPQHWAEAQSRGPDEEIDPNALIEAMPVDELYQQRMNQLAALEKMLEDDQLELNEQDSINEKIDVLKEKIDRMGFSYDEPGTDLDEEKNNKTEKNSVNFSMRRRR